MNHRPSSTEALTGSSGFNILSARVHSKQKINPSPFKSEKDKNDGTDTTTR